MPLMPVVPGEARGGCHALGCGCGLVERVQRLIRVSGVTSCGCKPNWTTWYDDSKLSHVIQHGANREARLYATDEMLHTSKRGVYNIPLFVLEWMQRTHGYIHPEAV